MESTEDAIPKLDFELRSTQKVLNNWGTEIHKSVMEEVSRKLSQMEERLKHNAKQQDGSAQQNNVTVIEEKNDGFSGKLGNDVTTNKKQSSKNVQNQSISNHVAEKVAALEHDDMNDNLFTKISERRRFKQASFSKKIPTCFSWVLCILLFTYFFYFSLSDFLEENPISIISYRNLQNNDASVSIKVCNYADLDPAKIQEYIANNSDKYSNYTIDDFYHKTPLQHRRLPLKSFYAYSTEIYERTKVEVQQFMVGCNLWHNLLRTSCVSHFKWHFERLGACFLADLKVMIDPQTPSVYIDFYFDPELNIESYGSNHGAFVSVDDPSNYVSPLDGVFVGPKQQTFVSAEIIHNKQTKSFKKLKCVQRKGSKEYFFTGEPFETSYNAQSCYDLCIAETEYKLCNCSTQFGWNITNRECILDSATHPCLGSLLGGEDSTFQSLRTRCISKCSNRCNTKNLELKVSNIYQPLKSPVILFYLEDWASYSEQDSYLAKKLLQQVQSSENSTASLEKISENYSRFILRIQNYLKVIETIPLISSSAFMAGTGGLIGMWLGLSVFSLIECLQNLLRTQFPRFRRFL